MLDTASLLKDLTEPQRAAVAHVDGPLLIVAGAGSGKTRVITRRVAYLMAQGIPPWSILAITFTNKAAGEMKQRVGDVTGRQVRDFGRLDQPWPLVCTFHSLCLRILRHYAPQVGLPANFSVYDSSDQTKLVKEALKTLEVSSDNFSPGTVHGTISDAKNKLVTPQQFAENARDFYHRTAARVYAKYQALLTQNNALDFDDLMMRTVFAFRDHPAVLAELQERFQYILIDEYQDTNRAQYVLAHALALKHRNLCVVGDPDQSIYAWRGADLANILDFEKDYADATVIRLEQNYRSTKTILAIASKLIAKNVRRKEKSLWTENPQGDKAELYLCQDEHDEADVVMRWLRDLNEKQKVPWSEMAVFYRMNSLSRVMEEALFKNKVPYQIARGTEFYNRKEIKDVLAYLRVIANPADEVSLGRIVNVPTRGLGDTSLKQVQAYGIANGMGLFDALGEAGRINGVSTRAANSAAKFVEMVRKWRKLAGVDAASSPSPGTPGEGGGGGPDEVGWAPPTVPSESDAEAVGGAHPTSEEMPSSLFGDESEWDAAPVDEDEPLPADEPFAPPEEVAPPADQVVEPALANPEGTGRIRALMEEVVKTSGMEAHLRKTGDSDLSELKNVEELISAAAQFDEENPTGTLHDYLAQVSLVSDADHLAGSGGAVTLMTLHAAKGLEFPVVAIIGLEDGVLPHSRARDNMDELEEERRLFFVGITRAEQRLMITKAQVRTVRGLRERTITSPFLNELPEENVTTIDRTGIGDLDRGGRGRGGGDDDYERQFEAAREERLARRFAGFSRGQTVKHPTFGIGKIAELTESGSKTRAVVEFTKHGRKTLILEHARLEAVG
ncbi:MAG TPA: UvrD-helicase domain-containing protein [Humisphaera sp.]